MRLLFVHERFGALGGAEVNVLLTARELSARGHTVGLLHGPATGREEAAWRETFPARFSLAGASSAIDALDGALQQFQPDVAFVHKLADLDVVAALAAQPVPVARMVHDHDLCCLRRYKYHPLSRRICTRALSPYCVFPCGATLARDPERRLTFRWISYGAKRRELALNRRFQRVIVATDYMKQELMRNGFAGDAIETHAPVPRPAATAFQSTFGPRNLIVYAGQVIRGKGVDVLLEALARVREPFECVVLGDGNHRAHCEDLSHRLGLAGRVRFAGFVPPEEIPGFYREATLAVMSSVWPEPFGAVGLEAMRCGLPVVAFDAGGIREWLVDGWNGFLVPWMDRAGYADRVERLLRDKPLARQLGEHGRTWAGERFGFANYVTGLENLFRRLAGRGPTIP